MFPFQTMLYDPFFPQRCFPEDSVHGMNLDTPDVLLADFGDSDVGWR